MVRPRQVNIRMLQEMLQDAHDSLSREHFEQLLVFSFFMIETTTAKGPLTRKIPMEELFLITPKGLVQSIERARNRLPFIAWQASLYATLGAGKNFIRRHTLVDGERDDDADETD